LGSGSDCDCAVDCAECPQTTTMRRSPLVVGVGVRRAGAQPRTGHTTDRQQALGIAGDRWGAWGVGGEGARVWGVPCWARIASS
jgi:hypothetical protein